MKEQNTPPADTPKENVPLEERGRLTRVQMYTLLAVLSIAILGLCGFIVWNYYQTEDSTTTQPVVSTTTETEEVTDTPTEAEDTTEVTNDITNFTGTYITAKLPEDWSLQEGGDGEGEDTSLMEQTEYEGLTSIEIFTSGNSPAFSIAAVDGFGYSPDCAQYFSFPDDDSEYRAQIFDYNEQFGESSPTIVTIQAGTYISYSLLGVDVRRANHTIYWDTIDEDELFQAGCGGSFSVITLPDIEFTSAPNSSHAGEHHSYQWKLSETLTSEELVTLDSILTSIEPK